MHLLGQNKEFIVGNPSGLCILQRLEDKVVTLLSSILPDTGRQEQVRLQAYLL